MQISKYDLCDSCREIHWRQTNGMISSMSIGDFLDLPAYNTAYAVLNNAVLEYLNDGGCSSCKSLLRRALL